MNPDTFSKPVLDRTASVPLIVDTTYKAPVDTDLKSPLSPSGQDAYLLILSDASPSETMLKTFHLSTDRIIIFNASDFLGKKLQDFKEAKKKLVWCNLRTSGCKEWLESQDMGTQELFTVLSVYKSESSSSWTDDLEDIHMKKVSYHLFKQLKTLSLEDLVSKVLTFHSIPVPSSPNCVYQILKSVFTSSKDTSSA